MSDKKKHKHRCPALPEGLAKVTPAGWNGESADEAKRMWYAWLRIIQMQRPNQRKVN